MRVVDFTTLLPGPLATLFLAEAGATAARQRPSGDGRSSRKLRRGEAIEFALLNRGKKSVVADTNETERLHKDKVRRLVLEADVLVEQFRPGVMARLGLGWEDLQRDNPRLIYCSISGYGQNGPLAQVAGHDLNYIARSGMLSQSVDRDGKPVLPQSLMADIGGGTYPAVINILLALMQRQSTGSGCLLDIAMCENTFPWMRTALAPILVGDPPVPPISIPTQAYRRVTASISPRTVWRFRLPRLKSRSGSASANSSGLRLASVMTDLIPPAYRRGYGAVARTDRCRRWRRCLRR